MKSKAEAIDALTVTARALMNHDIRGAYESCRIASLLIEIMKAEEERDEIIADMKAEEERDEIRASYV